MSKILFYPWLQEGSGGEGSQSPVLSLEGMDPIEDIIEVEYNTSKEDVLRKLNKKVQVSLRSGEGLHFNGALPVEWGLEKYNPTDVGKHTFKGAVQSPDWISGAEGISFEASVTIKSHPDYASDVTIFPKGDIVLDVGASIDLRSTTTPAGKPVVWTIEGENLVKKTDLGEGRIRLTGVETGAITITCASAFDPSVKDSVKGIVSQKIAYFRLKENLIAPDFIPEGRFNPSTLIIDTDETIDFTDATVNGKSYKSKIEKSGGSYDLVPNWMRSYINSFITSIDAKTSSGVPIKLLPSTSIYVKGEYDIGMSYGFTNASVRFFLETGPTKARASGFFSDDDMIIRYKEGDGEFTEERNAGLVSVKTDVQDFKDNVFQVPKEHTLQFIPEDHIKISKEPYNDTVYMLSIYDKDRELKDFAKFGPNVAPLTSIGINSVEYKLNGKTLDKIELDGEESKFSVAVNRASGKLPHGVYLKSGSKDFAFDESDSSFTLASPGVYDIELLSDQNDLYFNFTVEKLT